MAPSLASSNRAHSLPTPGSSWLASYLQHLQGPSFVSHWKEAGKCGSGQ